MITGIHTILYSKNPDADKAFFNDILQFSNVDIGHGWLIFKCPPAELAVHPGESGYHEFYLMCDDIHQFIQKMSKHRIVCSEIQNLRWGDLTSILLPGGSRLGVYQPKHTRPS